MTERYILLPSDEIDTARVRNVADVRNTMSIYCPTGHGEIRVVVVHDSIEVCRFHQHDEAIAFVKRYPQAYGVYVVMNPFDASRIKKHAVDDDAVTHRHFLLIDYDPDRPNPKQTNATETQRAAALTTANALYMFLLTQGWKPLIIADSGNGVHLIYVIDLPNDDASRILLQRVLKVLAKRFDTKTAHLDRRVFNASRIAKLYGTWARKGPHSAERPHRLSRLAQIAATRDIVTVEMLRALVADEADDDEPPP